MSGTRLAALALALLLAAGGCSSGTEGRLMPEPAQGVTLAKTDVADDTARLRAGPLAVSVSGNWTSRGSQTLYVSYANTGSVPVRVSLSGLALRHGGEAAGLVAASDETGYDPAGQATPRPLLGADRSDAIDLPAGATRKVMAEFSRFVAPPIDGGATLTASLPTTTGAAQVRLRCGAQ